MKSLALTLAVAAAALLGCAGQPSCPVERTVRTPAYEAQPLAAYSGSTQGTIESVAPDLCSLTLRDEAGGRQSVQLTGGTLVVSEGEAPGGIQELSPGQRVRVSYRRYGDNLVADQVEIVPRGAAPREGP